MHKCSNCNNCSYEIERWDFGEIMDSYYTCKVNKEIITATEQVHNCSNFTKKEVVPYKFQREDENLDILELPF